MINTNKDDFYLLQDILDRNYFSFFRTGNNKNIEFILSNQCSNNCENCYMNLDSEIYKGQEIFVPTKTNKFINLMNLIDWYINNEFKCDIFLRGCIEEESIDIIEIFQNIKNKFINTDYYPQNIYIYTKIKDIPLLNKIKLIFANTNINIIYIILINGYYCDNNLYLEEYYDNIIDFIKNNNCLIKSEINSNNIINWIKNYKWWIIKLGFDNLSKLFIEEILNNNWDLESIQNYLNFLDFQVDFLSQNLNNFPDYIFQNKLNFTTIQILDQEILTNKNYYQNCSFHNNLAIDISTLKMPICHKLNYPIYHIGEFLQDGKNLIINPINIAALVTKAHLKRSSTPHCEYCTYLNLCEKTCYGENFKVSYNLLCPIKNSCNLIKSKYNFLFYKYNLMNLLNLENYNLNNTFKKDLSNIKSKLLQGDILK